MMRMRMIFKMIVFLTVVLMCLFQAGMSFGQENPTQLWYLFDETSGTIAADSSGSGRTGTLVGGPTWVAGKIGNAVSLSGSSQYIAMPSGVVNGLTNFTITAWVWLDTLTTWTRIFDFGTGTTVNMFLTPSSGSTMRFAITTGGSGSEQRINGTSVLGTGAWKHVAVTLSGSLGTLYVDSVSVGTNPNMTLTPSSLGNTTNNYIGRSEYSSDPYLDGQIDDFRIYNRALTGSEIQSLYSGTPSTPGPTPDLTNPPTVTLTPTDTPGPTAIPTVTPAAATAAPTDAVTPESTNVPTTPPAGQPVWSGGPYTFDGTNPVTTTNTIGISGNASWSIAVWIYPFTGGPGDGYGWGVVGWGNASSNQGNFLYYNDVENTIEYGFYSNDAQTGANYPPNTWYHLADTYDGTTQRIYINGAEVASRVPGTLAIANTTAKIGTDPFGQGRNFNGGMDSVAIYNTTLSAAAISSMAAAQPGWIPSGPTPAPTADPNDTPEPMPTEGPITGVQQITMKPYTINSTLWNNRISNLIANWVPYLYNQCNNINLAEGGINNFIQAGRKNAGLSYTGHVGYWFSPVWVLGTFESMCYANMVGGNFTSQINNWLPTFLAAQQSDGYMSTWHQLGGYTPWDTAHRDAHEGYVAGYWIEAGIAHYLLTGSTQYLDAAKKLADCWYNGKPGQGLWWDGHQAIKIALCRLARLTGDTKYVQLSRTLLEVRTGGGTYDQSHTYPRLQTEAVGHSVRAAYMYAGMADVAAILNDSTYRTASDNLWNNLINCKYYITGGLGSGETSEGFGANYSLPQAAYCETCAGIGNMFFNGNMMLLHQDAKYIDLLENSLYNNVLGSMDLSCRNFYYTNPLDQSNTRYAWHSCPCCVHNIARTWLQLPRWMYAKSSDVLFVNLFIGSTVDVGTVGGTNVSMTQSTNYPWDGSISITVNPTQAATFTIKVRSPNRSVSTLYSSSPTSDGITSISVNGTSQSTTATNGYVTITRTWSPGDRIDIVLPMNIERITAISNVSSCVGKVALQRGPIIYTIESVDQTITNTLSSTAALTYSYDSGLLNGVGKITGTYTNGSAFLAIPNYARMNRGGSCKVWISAQ